MLDGEDTTEIEKGRIERRGAWSVLCSPAFDVFFFDCSLKSSGAQKDEH